MRRATAELLTHMLRNAVADLNPPINACGREPTREQDLERDATDDSEKSHPRGELESREGGGTYPRPSFG
jgi:hypothetical protein